MPALVASLPVKIRALLAESAVVVFFLALAALYTRPLASHLFDRMPAGSDPLISLWNVSWLSSHLLRPGLFEGNIFHPFPHAILHSDLSMGTAILVAPLRPLLRDPVPLFNAAVLIALAFSGWAFHALVFALSGSRSAGLLSGVLATFGSHQMSHAYHLNLISTAWIALFVLGLFRLVDRPGWRPALLAGLGFGLSAMSNGYYAVACVIVALVFAAVYARPLLDRRRLGATVLATVVATALLWPFVSAFLSMRRDEGDALRRDPALSEEMAFRPARDLGSRGYLYRQALGGGGQQLFPGVLTLALAALCIIRRRPASVFLAVASMALLLVALGPRTSFMGQAVPLPYDVLSRLPLLESMRHPYTFAAVATFLLAVMAGLGWASLAASGRRSAGAAIVAAAILETFGPGLAVRPVPPGVPPAYVHLAALPPGAALDLPVLEPETMLWAARHGLPMVNGFGAFTPLYTATLHRYVRRHWMRRPPEDVDASKPTLFLRREFDARYVIVPIGRRPGLRALAAAFDRSRSFRLVVEVEDGDRIYEVQREER
jgi:hypothetical protein